MPVERADLHLGTGERGRDDIVPGLVLESLVCGVSALHADESSIRYANWRRGGIENDEYKTRGMERGEVGCPSGWAFFAEGDGNKCVACGPAGG